MIALFDPQSLLRPRDTTSALALSRYHLVTLFSASDPAISLALPCGSWQGAYFVLLKPDIVLCASSDRYLEMVLRRVDGRPKARALPDNLPEWKYVDFDAPAWMIRHVPQVAEKATVVGAAATFSKNGFRIGYIPKVGSDLNIGPIRNQWLMGGAEILHDQLKTARQPDGTFVLSFGEKFTDETLWFGWMLYESQAFELLLEDKEK